MTTTTCTITKTLIAENERMGAIPRYLGKHAMDFEMRVYSFMDRFCEDYSGGFWDFYRLSNGGFFMSLSGDEKFKVVNGDNYFSSEMSAEAASIGVNIYALNSLMWEDNFDSKILELYDKLRDYADLVPEEAGEIFSFID